MKQNTFSHPFDACHSRRRVLALLAVAGIAPMLPDRLRGAQTGPAANDEIARMRIAYRKRETRDKALILGKLKAKFGPGVLDVVRETVIADARDDTRQSQLPARDLAAIMDILWNPSKGLLDFTVAEQSTHVLRLRVHRCIFAEEMRRHQAADIGLACFCAYDYGFCEGFNPALRFTRTRTLMQGHDCCDHAYRLP